MLSYLLLCLPVIKESNPIISQSDWTTYHQNIGLHKQDLFGSITNYSAYKVRIVNNRGIMTLSRMIWSRILSSRS